VIRVVLDDRRVTHAHCDRDFVSAIEVCRRFARSAISELAGAITLSGVELDRTESCVGRYLKSATEMLFSFLFGAGKPSDQPGDSKGESDQPELSSSIRDLDAFCRAGSRARPRAHTPLQFGIYRQRVRQPGDQAALAQGCHR
jgi:hypothetical protein